MPVKIPVDIQKHIELIKKGKGITQKKEKKYSKEELFSKAVENLKFLNEVAYSESIHSFLKDEALAVLGDFSNRFPDDDNFRALIKTGYLLLETRAGVTGLYYWLDTDFPANRSDRDHQLVTEEELKNWSPKSIEIFSKLTRDDIWENIRTWIMSIRKHLR
ncbi:MAG: hypothetical protein AAB679_02025 [Patescibacteria group bacterium]